MFYSNFCMLCDAKGVSRTKACTDCGVSRTAWNKWRDGAIPNGITLNRFADYFGTSVDALLGTEHKKEQPTVSDELSDAVSMELLNMIRDASEAERRDMLDLLRIVQKRREGK